MKEVWKFRLPNRVKLGTTPVSMPPESQVLTVSTQDGVGPVMWALIDTDRIDDEEERRWFLLCGTGHAINRDASELSYVGTFQMPPMVAAETEVYVGHVFEVVPKEGADAGSGPS